MPISSMHHSAWLNNKVVSQQSFAVTPTATLSLNNRAVSGTDYEAAAVVELDIATGDTRRYSFEGLATPLAYFEPRITSIGAVVRDVNPLGGIYTCGDVTVRLSNVDGAMSSMKNSYALRNRPIRVRFGNLYYGLSAIRSRLTGVVTNWRIADKQMEITARDTSFDRLRQKIGGYFNRDTFPTMPGSEKTSLVPIVYGDVSSVGLSDKGAVQATLVEANNGGNGYIYIVARHSCKAITNVYRYGVMLDSSAYTLTTVNSAAGECQAIVFSTDQRDTTRSNEREITADVQGIMDGGGTLIENPIDQLEHFLLNYCGFGALELHDAAFTANATKATSLKGAFAIVDENATREDVVAKISESFALSVFINRYGYLSVYLYDSGDISSPSGFTSYDETQLREFSIESARDIATRLQYNFGWNYVENYFHKQPDCIDSTEETSMGAVIRANRNMYCIRDSATALTVATNVLSFMKENQQYARATVPMNRWANDLNDYIKVTNWQGVGASGYSNAIFRIVGVTENIAPKNLNVDLYMMRVA